jgi:hypothetical protein
MQVTTVGLDIAKRMFQVHGVDAGGRIAIRRKLQRGEVAWFFATLPPCLVRIEGMCDGAPLGSRDWSICASSAADPAGLRQAILRSTTEAPRRRNVQLSCCDER